MQSKAGKYLHIVSSLLQALASSSEAGGSGRHSGLFGRLGRVGVDDLARPVCALVVGVKREALTGQSRLGTLKRAFGWLPVGRFPAAENFRKNTRVEKSLPKIGVRHGSKI